MTEFKLLFSCYSSIYGLHLIYSSVGVSNFGIQHLKGLAESGLPTPSVNQIELHPFMKREELVKYCRDQGIVVMGFSPLARAKRNDDPDLIRISKKFVYSLKLDQNTHIHRLYSSTCSTCSSWKKNPMGWEQPNLDQHQS